MSEYQHQSNEPLDSDKEPDRVSLDSDDGILNDPSISQATVAALKDLIKQAKQSAQAREYSNSIKLYTDAINLAPVSHVLYSNRAAIFSRLDKHSRALQDAIKARELNPRWPTAYYRQGIALQALGRYADSMAAFASGLAQDNRNYRLLAGLVEAAMKSPFRALVEPIYRQLKAMQLDKSPFVVCSVIGQELLKAGHHPAAVVVLESSLRIGTCSMKLRGTVYSSLGTAYWRLNEMEKAIQYMQSDLQVAKSLGDQLDECRSHGNLGGAYFSMGNYQEALTSHRNQLVLAMKANLSEQAAAALTALGHCYTALGDAPNALASHKQCLQIVRQLGDQPSEIRELFNVGSVYLSMMDNEKAIEFLEEHLKMAKQINSRPEEAKACSNLAAAYLSKRQFEKAIEYYQQLHKLGQDLMDKAIEARACGGLGHASRMTGDVQAAKKWYEKQLDISLAIRNKDIEGRACSNLGIVYQMLGDFDGALKLHWAHLQIAKNQGDTSAMGRAYGHIGSCYSSLHRFDEAMKYQMYVLANGSGSKKARSICSN